LLLRLSFCNAGDQQIVEPADYTVCIGVPPPPMRLNSRLHRKPPETASPLQFKSDAGSTSEKQSTTDFKSH